MRLSRFFLPILKEDPSEAEIASHKLMLRAGMVRQSSAGIYTWLPLGLMVLKKIEQIVREEQWAAGANEVMMPTVQPADLWRESGRYDAYGPEMLRIRDRHDREMLYGPTHEEVITDIFRKNVRSYKDLPLNLFQIQWKFRDEVRPRFGVMRGREFLMKDNYSFDLDEASAIRSYNIMFLAYLRTFARLGVRALPMKAANGPIGGDMSHEFVVLAQTGESGVFFDRGFDGLDPMVELPESSEDLQAAVDPWTGLYSATDEMHDPATAPDDLVEGRGIEVGHIFNFGTYYSEPLNAAVQGPDGERILVNMGSYGIGVSRLAGAIIEASHDEGGIVWPNAVAPFDVAIINLRQGDEACDTACADLEARLEQAGKSVLYDDTADRAGAKFAKMDLIGLPWQIIAGPRGLKDGRVEVKHRASGERHELSIEDALNRVTG